MKKLIKLFNKLSRFFNKKPGNYNVKVGKRYEIDIHISVNSQPYFTVILAPDAERLQFVLETWVDSKMSTDDALNMYNNSDLQIPKK